MKKSILAIAIIAVASTGTFAQGKKLEKSKVATTIAPATDASKAATDAAATTIKFKSETHDFGELKEGDAADAEFVFTNTGSKPLTITNVQPSCGCTTPTWTKDPIAPGKTGVIKAAYGTKGRPGAFNKSITVNYNGGTQVIYIKGNVEKAPESSAPQNNSMMKTN
jgi:hypothetical protein